MNILIPQISFQEVPNEVSLGFICTGCPLRYTGCHSFDTWDANKGILLTESGFTHWLKRYRSLITCVVFFGGEWHEQSLFLFLKIAQKHNLKTCLYTGLDDVSPLLKSAFTYLKTGRYIRRLGGLSSITTNQRFVELSSGRILNSLFIKG